MAVPIVVSVYHSIFHYLYIFIYIDSHLLIVGYMCERLFRVQATAEFGRCGHSIATLLSRICYCCCTIFFFFCIWLNVVWRVCAKANFIEILLFICCSFNFVCWFFVKKTRSFCYICFFRLLFVASYCSGFFLFIMVLQSLFDSFVLLFFPPQLDWKSIECDQNHNRNS